MTSNVLAMGLLRQFPDGNMPPVLNVQLDNCWRENKNRLVLAFLALLVALGLFECVTNGYLMVGHTHDGKEQELSEEMNFLLF